MIFSLYPADFGPGPEAREREAELLALAEVHFLYWK